MCVCAHMRARACLRAHTHTHTHTQTQELCLENADILIKNLQLAGGVRGVIVDVTLRLVLHGNRSCTQWRAPAQPDVDGVLAAAVKEEEEEEESLFKANAVN